MNVFPDEIQLLMLGTRRSMSKSFGLAFNKVRLKRERERKERGEERERERRGERVQHVYIFSVF